MAKFRSPATLQKFAAVHASVHNHFNQERHLYSRKNFKLNRSAALAEWRELSAPLGAPDGRFRRPARFSLTPPLLALRNRMTEGNVRAFRAYKEFLAKYEPQETGSSRGYLVVPAEMTKEERIREAEKTNVEVDARHAARIREYAAMTGRVIP